jgi:hypothetical protein
VMRHIHIVQRHLWKTQYRVSDFQSRLKTKLISVIGYTNNSDFVNMYNIFFFPSSVEIIPTIWVKTLSLQSIKRRIESRIRKKNEI